LPPLSLLSQSHLSARVGAPSKDTSGCTKHNTTTMSTNFWNYLSNGLSNSSALEPGHLPGEVFQCMWSCADGLCCNDLIRGHNLSTHLREVHGIHGTDKTRFECKWNSCNREYYKESLVRHVEEVHMRIVYSCKCGNRYFRRDTLNKHRKTCSG
jgi:hypothetical protein